MAGGGGRATGATGAGGAAWSRRAAARARSLRALVRDTQRALHDVADILNFDPEISATVEDVGSLLSRPTALVVLGTSAPARARLLHSLLGRPLLPDPAPRGSRWLRIQYGSSTQVHLTLGNSEFELVEELECNRRAWDTLPLEDLLRQDQTDLSTMLEIELDNTFLIDGHRIIVPPDLETDPGQTNYQTLKQLHSDFCSKRELILKNYNPVYLYAIDKIGRNVFSENIVSGSMVNSRSEEDFWSSFNLYCMTRVNDCDKSEVRSEVFKESGEPAVFTAENCLDLHQLKELNPHSQLLFVLFSDSVDMTEENRREVSVNEATESAEFAYCTEELPESDQGLQGHTLESPSLNKSSTASIRLHEEQIGFMNELLDQWELMANPPPKHYVKSQWLIIDDVEITRTAEHKPASGVAHKEHGARSRESERERVVASRTALLGHCVKFTTECLHSYLLEFSTKLSEVHVKLLQQFILASFDLARELQVVPKKIQYVASREQLLYETINNKFCEGDKKQELVQIMQEVLQEMRSEVQNMDWSVDDLPCHQDRRFMISNSIFYSSGSPDGSVRLTPRPDGPASAPSGPSGRGEASDGEEALSYDSYCFDDYEIIHSNDDSFSATESYSQLQSAPPVPAAAPAGHILVENEEFSLSTFSSRTAASVCTNAGNVSVKEASLDVQQTVLSRLSRKISLKLVKFVDCLRDTYFGTLQRCLQSLEWSCRRELGGRPASEAMRSLVDVARQVDLTPCASFSLLRSLLENLRRLFHKLRVSSGEAEWSCCVLSPSWRRHVALHTVHSLTPHRLARVISTQILDKLTVAHEKYQSALTSLQTALESRLHHTEVIKLAIRKKYAPSFARLCLESTSMCDLLIHGTPDLGREIGRGQYGVVHAVRGSWAGHSPVAVKSVLPGDERHYHELAMEFFYTRSIPAHPRIVRLLGSVVQRAAGGGPAGVLLVSERKVRDLHAAVRAGLSFAQRMRIACDIVEGIRYLHSLGLVHRDIKMKNVLLDSADRASLSDLGFCALEALISGSVVGTPVHMAPELLAGEYTGAVDVYAFGILFWYVCAGNIKMPTAFETFQNKEQLWSKVKRGLRPERLPHFSDECWDIMEACWASEPSQRALLGDVQPKLEAILEKALQENTQIEPSPDQDKDYDLSDDDSLYMTGIGKNGL